MRRKSRKRARKSFLLCLLSLLIVLPNSVFANLETTDDTSTPAVENTEQIDVDLAQPELDPVPEPEPTVETTPAVETETEADPVVPEAPDPANPVVHPVVPEIDQLVPEIAPVNPEAAAIDLAAEEEVTYPEVGEVTFTPRDAHVGDTVKITAKMNNGTVINAEPEEVYAWFWTSGDWRFDDEQSIRLRYDAENEQWIGFFIVKETWNPGYWTTEVDGYWENWGWEYKEINASFNVLNVGDSTPPQIVDVMANPNPAEAGKPVTFTATLKDVNNESEIVYAHLMLDFGRYAVLRASAFPSYDEEIYVPLTYDSTLGKWVGTYIVPANAPDGTYIYYSTVTVDRAGNLIDDDGEDNWYDRFIEVSNNLGELVEVNLDNDYYYVDEDTEAIVNVSVKVKDNSSGVKSVAVGLDNETHFTILKLVNGVWVGSIKLTSFDREDSYDVLVFAEYNNGSTLNYEYGERFYLENPNTDFEAPVVSDVISINPDKPKVGDEIRITADVRDEQSGIESVTAEVYYYSYGNEPVPFDLKYINGKWEGTFKLQVYDPKGFEIIVRAKDKAGNSDYNFKTFGYDQVWVDKWNDDTRRPNIDYVKYPAATLRLGENFHIETKLFDESGILSAKVTLTKVERLNNFDIDPYFDDEFSAISLDLKYNDTKGVWEADYLLPLDGPTGLFVINIIALDNAGNQTNKIHDWNFGDFPPTMVILPGVPIPEGNKPVEGGITPINPVPVIPIPVSNKTIITGVGTVLPNTSTNNFNLLFGGFALIVIGGASFIVRRKEVK